jgi:thiol-disulfide isomerase/thioredoxin
MTRTKNYRKKTNRNKRSNRKSRKVNKNPIIVGVLHASWCGHCQTLMPKWKIVKQKMLSNSKYSNKYQFVDIEDSDAQKDHKMNQLNLKINDKSVQLSASGFPTIFKIQNGVLEYYNGSREEDLLQAWVTSQTPVITKESI